MYWASLWRGHYSVDWSRLGRHCLFWASYLVLVPFQTNLIGLTNGYNMMVAIQWLPFSFLDVYSFLYIVLPCLLAGRWATFWLRLLLWCFGFLGCLYIYFYYIVLPLNTGQPLLHFIDHPSKVTQILVPVPVLIEVCYTVIAASLTLWRAWYQREHTTQQLAQQTTLAELQLLRAQIHPHFLFNTLNNLYSLTLRQADNTPEIVLKLTELLHYMLDECNVATVPLQKEMQAIESYIELEKLRYSNRLAVILDVAGDVAGQSIPSLLLIPFVENAFKHGPSGQTGQAYIHIQLRVVANELVFSVVNSKSDIAPPARKFGGMGLTNVRKRLDLLFPQQHSLIIRSGKNEYEIELTIPCQATARSPKAVRSIA